MVFTGWIGCGLGSSVLAVGMMVIVFTSSPVANANDVGITPTNVRR
jgi:hypothetical protein